MYKIFFLLILLPSVLMAQFNDNFSDGDFATNPAWAGQTEKFQIDASQQLQLNEVDFTGSAYLSTPSEVVPESSWEFLVKFDFNSSSANYAKVFAVSNQNDVSGNLNGYFVRVGYTNDEVSLFRQDGSQSVLLIDGIDNRINTTTVNVRIKLTRDEIGNWSLFSDSLGGFDYVSEGTAFDNTYLFSGYSGVHCIYTTTRKDKIFFDDFVVTGNTYVDTEAPIFQSIQLTSANSIQVVFNEALSEESALNLDNFEVNFGIGNPSSISFVEGNQSILLLNFTDNFISGTNYTLQYQNIADLSNNIAPSGFAQFSYVTTEPNIVVINEIMVDPSPVVGLPDAEYIEIYNTSGANIDLSGWRLIVGNYVRDFPASQIEANGYLVLCTSANSLLFETGTPVLAIPSFPAIPNDGKTIKLFDADSIEINAVSYDASWYQNSDKDDGGWSLEKIDPANNCGGMSNWIASVNSAGGTPGYLNSVYALNPDNTPPTIVSLQVNAGNEIILGFSEYIDTLSALNINNYEVLPDYSHPDYVAMDADGKSVHIFVAYAFNENSVYTVSASNIKDLCGNMLINGSMGFSVYTPKQYDIIITEIMADPDPVVGLPNAEYVELYNSSEFPIDLSDWKFYINTSSCVLPPVTLAPGTYITLCNINNLSLFSAIVNVLGVSSFPAMTNSGALLSLVSKEGAYIHSVSYSDAWYNNDFKKAGGWSLEMIDTINVCEGEENWTASNHTTGGTPSSDNSVLQNNPDVSLPYVTGAEIVNQDTVRVYFSETMRLSSISPIQNYLVDHNVGYPSWVFPEPPQYNTVLMTFDTIFTQGIVYELIFADTLSDCMGNNIFRSFDIIFGIPDSICSGDLVINEILFNPFPDGYDFVEFYNNSDKLFDLKQLWLTRRDDIGEPEEAKQASLQGKLVLPHSYVAVTASPADIESRYNLPYPEKIISSVALPSLNDDAGNIVVFDRNMNVIDEFAYSSDMHFELLASDEGVSLERVDFNQPTNSSANWHSAAGSEGYATPGYQNSQYRPSDVEVNNSIVPDPQVFSPDNDGYNDRLNINYSFEYAGTVATIAIYDAKGRFITYIVQNESLSTEGTLFWDGLDNRNQLCPIGIYVIYAEYYNANGIAKSEKMSCVLSLKKI